MNYDQVDDRAGVKMAAFAASGLLPGYVIEAAEADLLGDVNSRRAGISHYPVHTKAATVLSALYYYAARRDGAAADPAVEHNLAASAAHFGATADLHQVKAALAPAAARPLDPAAFLFSFPAADGSVERRCPVVDAGSLTLAAELVVSGRAGLTPEDRCDAAGRLADRAAVLGLPLGGYRDQVYKYAGRAEVDQAGIRDAIRTRADLLYHRAADAAALRQWERALDPAVDGPTAAKYAALLERVDVETGLDRLYGAGGLNPPFDTVFFQAGA